MLFKAAYESLIDEYDKFETYHEEIQIFKHKMKFENKLTIMF